MFADDTGHVKHFKNFAQFKYFAEVSDLVNGKAQGRMNDKERILAYNIGISVHDVYFAAHIFKQIVDSEQPARSIDMREPKAKFWL